MIKKASKVDLARFFDCEEDSGRREKKFPTPLTNDAYRCKMHIVLKQLEDVKHLPLYAYRCDMTEVNKDKGQFHNAVTEAWSKNWLVPEVLLMLLQWSSYGYELMEK